MKIAVTGANGFIGRHVLTELAQHDVTVIPLVRNALPLKLPESIQTQSIVLDIHAPPENVFECIGKPDILMHLAWDGLANYKSLHHFEQELPKQYLFLQNLIKSGLKNLIITGTCVEYGMQSGPLQENMPIAPNIPYGFAKATLYKQLEYLQQDYPFALTWGRLFYTYGDGQAKNSLLPQLRHAVAQGNKIFNMSGGEQLRDYLPVTQVAQYLVSLALINNNIGIINICSGKPISVRRLVEQWLSNNHWDISLNFGYYPYPDYEPMAFWGDRRKLDQYVTTNINLN
ncbi:epimerase [Achromatium sp. WMS3]|nr:epimerase [Achromatium sp. WMS3]